MRMRLPQGQALTHARKIAAIERQLMKLRPRTREKILRIAYYVGMTR
jgi:hypothetical protein